MSVLEVETERLLERSENVLFERDMAGAVVYGGGFWTPGILSLRRVCRRVRCLVKVDATSSRSGRSQQRAEAKL